MGFRSIELVTRSRDGGHKFQFVVNGRPFFAFGANIIPLSSFQPTYTPADELELLKSAQEQHMNMIRVWGGGTYRNDHFYDTCDELGLLIYHDCMFNNAIYPTSTWFLNETVAEVAYQTSRLCHHPAIALWSGNNEIEASLKGNLQWTTYSKLNYRTVIPTVVRVDPTRPVWPSSPSNGYRAGHGPHALMPEPFSTNVSSADPAIGDTHYYKYGVYDGSNCWDTTGLPETHFIDEFGWPSYPSYESIAPFAVRDDDLHATSNFTQHREDWNCRTGYRNEIDGRPACIAPMLLRFADEPPGGWASTSPGVYRKWLYMTQVLQAACYAGQAEHYRRGRERPEATSGALYWQLNSMAPWSSKSSVEFNLRRKALHYAAMRFFEPLHLSLWFNRTSATSGLAMHIHLANDDFRATEFAGGILNVSVTHFLTGHEATVAIQPVQPLGVSTGSHLLSVAVDTLFSRSALCNSTTACFVTAKLWSGSTTARAALDSPPASSTIGFPVQFRGVSLPEASIHANLLFDPLASPTEATESIDLVLESDVVAVHVMLSSPVMGVFNPNFLVLYPYQPVNVTFISRATPERVTNRSFFLSSLFASCVNNVGSCLVAR